MIDEEQVKIIAKKVLDEEHLLGFIKIFEKEHNIFRGSHDKIHLPEALEVPDTIINQIVEKFDTQLTEGSIPIIGENGHFIELNDKLFYDKAKKILCLGLNSPETDMVGGYCMKEGTPPTQNIADCFQAYAKETPLERLTDGGLETWASATNLTYWTEFTDGIGTHERSSYHHSGSYSMKLTTTLVGSYCGFQQDLILNPGYNCKISIWYIRTAHEGSILKLYLTDDGPNVYLQDDGTWDSASNYFDLPVAETWTLFELEFIAHANYTNYTVRVYKSHSSGGAVSFYVDDISVSENRNVVPYFRTESGLVIGLNQDLRTSASVIYAGLTLTGFDGVLKAVDGVVTEAADHVDLANITANQHHNQVHATTHHSGGGDAIKLDNFASPDDNTDLNASTSKHGLLRKLGGGITNFLRADGSWAVPAGGGNGATTFAGLTDTPADYTGAENKIVKVNATPDALVFGANISDLEDVDSISGKAGKYGRVKAGDAGIEWVAGTGNGGEQGPVLILDSGFDDLALGNIDGKGVYSLWGAWVNASGAGCTAEIVADPGNGRMLRLDDQSGTFAAAVSLTMTPAISAEILVGIVEWKIKVSVLAASSRGYFRIMDKDIAGSGQGGFFRGDSDDIYYRSSGGIIAQLVPAVVDTWYTVRTFFDRLGNYAVWWADGAFEQGRIAMNVGDKFNFLELATRDIHSGCVYDIKYVKVWSLNYVQ